MTVTSLNIAEGTIGRSRLTRCRTDRNSGANNGDSGEMRLGGIVGGYERFSAKGGVGCYFSKPRLKAKHLILILVIAVACACAVGFFVFRKVSRTESDKNEPLVPPNPTKVLPPSPSHLHIFKKAAVCADGPPCAEIGKQVLERNGSAVDAAIAALFCNGVFNMQSMGIGGGFLMNIYVRENKTAYALNARESAPAKASPEFYKDDAMKAQSGILAVAVPGELRGYWAAYQRFGKLPWKDLVTPSIELCESGYNMTAAQYDGLLYHDIAVNDTNLREWFFNEDGSYKKAGSHIKPSKLCDTLRLISESDGDELYNGTLSKLLVQDIREAGGIITAEDLANYTALWEDPITSTFRNGDRLFSPPLPASGILLTFILNVLDGYEFTRDSVGDVNSTVLTYHRIIEAFKYAFAKRTELGDTRYVNISGLVGNLTSKGYAEEIRKRIRDDRTSPDPLDYGAVYYNQPDHGTAHISVLAANGDAVSVTSTVNIYFGAGLTSKSTGIVLNSGMDDFSSPYFKNYFGLPGSPNNAIAAGKRSLSSTCPSIIVDRDGDVRLVIGAAGGTKISTGVALAIMRNLWFEQNIKEAVDAPRIHHQLYPMEIAYEYGVLQQVIDGLEALGHKTRRYTDRGSVICALLKKGSLIFANADHRKGGEVYGYN